jgi:DNA-binding protein HU-beta
MTKKELVEVLAMRAEVSKAEAERVYNAMFALLAEEVAKGEVRVDGFGTFKLAERAAREAKNPRTGEVVKVPAKRVVTFKAASALKAKVK